MTEILDRFRIRRGTASDLAIVNEIPLADEIVYESDQGLVDGKYKIKIGDGTRHYNDLPYLAVGSAASSPVVYDDASGSITVDATQSNCFEFNLIDEVLIELPDNLVAGQRLIFLFKQDGSGSRKIFLDGHFLITDGSEPSLQANDTSLLNTYVSNALQLWGQWESGTSRLKLTGTFDTVIWNVPYSSDISISGGSGVYTNPQVIAGALPDGLELSIVGSRLRLSGTATVIGDADVTVSVDGDSDAGTASIQQHLVVSAASNPDAVSLWPKLVAWWQLNETGALAGLTAVDAHIYGFNATYAGASGAISSDATIRSGGTSSVLFNGNSWARCAVSTDAYILGAQDHAVFTWYRPNGTAAFTRLISSYDTGTGPSNAKNDQYGLCLDASFHPTSDWRYSSSSTDQLCTSTRTLTAAANYLVGYNKNTSAKTVQFFINNISETAIAYTHEPDGTSLPPQISQLKGQFDQQAHGALQDMMIFNAALTTSEIAYLYNGGVGRSYAEFKSASGN